MRRETFTRAGNVTRLPSAGGDEQRDDRPSYQCASPGCPMWGSISDQTAGEVPRRWCRFHFGAGGAHEDRITRALRAAMPAVRSEQEARDALARGAVALDWRDSLRQAEATLQAAVRDAA